MMDSHDNIDPNEDPPVAKAPDDSSTLHSWAKLHGAKHRDFSAVTHVAKDKGIPPFLILHVAGHPDTTAQALRLGNVLKDASVPVTVFGAKETTHNKINADLGKPDDPATKALFDFLGNALKK